jgi:hypothetical protein
MGEAEVVGARPQATERGTKVYFVKQLQVRDDGMLGSVLPNGDDYWRELDFADGTLCESRWSSVRGGCRFGLEPSLLGSIGVWSDTRGRLLLKRASLPWWQ